jgi:serine/threonine-protein phosphatase 5
MKNSVFVGNSRLVYVAGDIHGDYDSFRKILEMHRELPKPSLLLFLGDYADRGTHGAEIITELNKLISKRKNIVALKGNHENYIEGRPFFSPCDLIDQAQAKYGSWEKFYDAIMKKFMAKLRIAAIINNVLFVHGGITSKIIRAEDLSDRENEEDLLWSDPSAAPGEHHSMRGAGITFGEDITRRVLSSLGLRMIVRSHEPHKAAYGPCIEHGGRVITINACTSYGEPWKPFLLKMDTTKIKYEPVYL